MPESPTQVDGGLPEGWNAGPPQWLPPQNIGEEEGDLIVYGYAGRTLLISQVQVPDSAVVGDTVSIMADVSWLVCRELCIPGDARCNKPSRGRGWGYSARSPV